MSFNQLWYHMVKTTDKLGILLYNNTKTENCLIFNNYYLKYSANKLELAITDITVWTSWPLTGVDWSNTIHGLDLQNWSWARVNLSCCITLSRLINHAHPTLIPQSWSLKQITDQYYAKYLGQKTIFCYQLLQGDILTWLIELTEQWLPDTNILATVISSYRSLAWCSSSYSSLSVSHMEITNQNCQLAIYQL